MSPQDFHDMIAKVRASEGRPLELQESVDVVPPLIEDGNTEADALAWFETTQLGRACHADDESLEAFKVRALTAAAAADAGREGGGA